MAVSETRRLLGNFMSGRGSVGRYALIGSSGVAVDFILFTFLVGAGIFSIQATVISTFVGITNNFIWNSLLNFRVTLSGRRGAKFLTVGILGLVSSAGLLQLLIMADLNDLIAKALSIPIVVSGQFLANKFWTFRTYNGTDYV